MNVELDKVSFKSIKDVLDLMSNEQLVNILEETEDELINRGQSDKVYDVIDSSDGQFNGYTFKRSDIYQGQRLTNNFIGYQPNHYEQNKKVNDKWASQKNISYQQKKQLDNITEMTQNIFVSFNNKLTARLYALMLAKPSIEWGVYLVFEKKLPSIEDIWAKMTKKNQPLKKQPEYIIEISDMVIVPQHVGVGSVDYLEQEYPEMMKEVNEYRFKKYKTTGRLHSHHNMTAYHSGTDWGEFNKYLEIGDVYLSLVVATNKRFDDKIELKPENAKEFFSNLQFNVQYGIPEKEGDILGYITSGSVMLSTDLTEDDFKEAEEYVRKYNSMLETIDKTKVTYSVLKSMTDSEKIDEMEERELRTKLLEDPTTFKSFNILSEVTQQALKDRTKAEKETQEVRDTIKRLANRFGLFDTLEGEVKKLKTEIRVKDKPKSKSIITLSQLTQKTVEVVKKIPRASIKEIEKKKDSEKALKHQFFIIIKLKDLKNISELQQTITKKIKEYGNNLLSVIYTRSGNDEYVKGTYILDKPIAQERMQTIVDVIDKGQKSIELIPNR